MFEFLKRNKGDEDTALVDLMVELGWIPKQAGMQALASKNGHGVCPVLREQGVSQDLIDEAKFQLDVRLGKIPQRKIPERVLTRQKLMQGELLELTKAAAHK